MIEQIGIVVFSVTAAALTQSTNRQRRRYACLFGLASQPFWFWSSWQSESWGVFAISFVYAGIWAWGVYVHWIRSHNARRRDMRLVRDGYMSINTFRILWPLSKTK